MSNAPMLVKNVILELAEMYSVLSEEIAKQIPPWNFFIYSDNDGIDGIIRVDKKFHGGIAFHLKIPFA